MHPLPPVLTGGPPAMTVLIGGQPAWKGIPLAAAPGIMATNTSTEATLQALETTAKIAEAAALAAAGTPAAPAAIAAATAARLAAETAKAASAAANGAAITAAAATGGSVHACALPWPLPPHGPGVVIDGSPTVMIENSPACRLGDTIIEAIGPPNKITMGCPTVIIGSTGTIGNPGRAATFFPGAQSQKDSCALMSTQGIVQQSTGTSFSEPQMQTIGIASLAYTVCNGTTNEASIMTAAGVPATLRQNPSLQDIAAAVSQGRAVIVGLDARPVWGVASPQPIGHAIRVTGVDYDVNGNIAALHINDTGTGRANQTVPAATFQNALTGFGGGRMATSNNPVP
jgi:uncharacterized Zn-binding protein involved in type VI secretion